MARQIMTERRGHVVVKQQAQNASSVRRSSAKPTTPSQWASRKMKPAHQRQPRDWRDDQRHGRAYGGSQGRPIDALASARSENSPSSQSHSRKARLFPPTGCIPAEVHHYAPHRRPKSAERRRPADYAPRRSIRRPAQRPRECLAGAPGYGAARAHPTFCRKFVR